jgi:hypothetical protein
VAPRSRYGALAPKFTDAEDGLARDESVDLGLGDAGIGDGELGGLRRQHLGRDTRVLTLCRRADPDDRDRAARPG